MSWLQFTPSADDLSAELPSSHHSGMFRMILHDKVQATMPRDDMSTPESTIAMEERHVIEGAARVVRQESIVVVLKKSASKMAVANAEKTLKLMRDILDLSREHLAYLQMKQEHADLRQSQRSTPDGWFK